MELVYTTDLKSVASRLAGSIPAVLTKAPGIGLGAFVLFGLVGCGGPGQDLTVRPPAIGSFGNFIPSALATSYLACPVNYCNAQPDRYTNTVPVNADLMRTVVRTALDKLPGTRFVATEAEGLRLVYQLEAGAYPSAGTITIEIVDLDETQSGIVLYAQSAGASSKQNERDKTVRCLEAIIEAAKRPPTRADRDPVQLPDRALRSIALHNVQKKSEPCLT